MLNNISLLNFKSYTQAAKKNYTQKADFNVIAPNLIPLQKDTISFRGDYAFMVAIDNAEICAQIHDEAILVNQYLEDMLNKYFAKNLFSNEKPEGTIESIQARVKTGTSIQEKISDLKINI